MGTNVCEKWRIFFLAMFTLNINLGDSTGDKMEMVCMTKRKTVWPLVFLEPCGKGNSCSDFYCMVEDHVIFFFLFYEIQVIHPRWFGDVQ